MRWKILVSGYVPSYLYDNGRLEGGDLSFSQLQQRVHINERVHVADAAEDFSYRIRKQ
ncbi:MAG: hypothetical protein WBG65_06205 [Sulfurimonadaceae bacterium]